MSPVNLLVRVQDDLHGASADAQGLRLPYERADSGRNTLHFSVNCLVSDHAYGSFNEHADGSLKGKVVIIADPASLPGPAGLSQVDTWYRLSAEKDPASGAVNRFLPVGRAKVVAPRGTVIPQGVEAVFYDGGMQARDEKVRQVLESAGVKVEQSGFRSWMSHDMASAKAWAESAAPSFAGRDSSMPKDLHLGMHDSSLDGELEQMGVDGLLQGMESQRLHDGDDGTQTPYIEVIAARVAKDKAVLQDFLGALPAGERQRIGPHYEAQIEGLDASLVKAQALQAKWRQQELPGQIRAAVEDLPGTGPFFLAKSGATQHESLSGDELIGRLEKNQVNPQDRLWRSGMKAEWAEIEKTSLRDLVAPQALTPAQTPTPTSTITTPHPVPSSPSPASFEVAQASQAWLTAGLPSLASQLEVAKPSSPSSIRPAQRRPS